MIKKLYTKYKELIMYGIFGVLSTILNIGCFYIFDKMGMNTYINNSLSWIITIVFCFITNKLFVFDSKDTTLNVVVKEAISFLGARLTSYVVDMATIYLLIDILGFNKMISKIISNILVIIINYILSKLVVFRKDKKEVLE